MLPPRQAKRTKTDARWRSQAHLKFVRSFQCAIPGCIGMPVEAAHVRILGGGGMGFKPADHDVAPLCRDHHAQQHSIGERTFWETYAKASGQTVEQLIDALCQKSPKRREIAEVRNV